MSTAIEAWLATARILEGKMAVSGPDEVMRLDDGTASEPEARSSMIQNKQRKSRLAAILIGIVLAVVVALLIDDAVAGTLTATELSSTVAIVISGLAVLVAIVTYVGGSLSASAREALKEISGGEVAAARKLIRQEAHCPTTVRVREFNDVCDAVFVVLRGFQRVELMRAQLTNWLFGFGLPKRCLDEMLTRQLEGLVPDLKRVRDKLKWIAKPGVQLNDEAIWHGFLEFV